VRQETKLQYRLLVISCKSTSTTLASNLYRTQDCSGIELPQSTSRLRPQRKRKQGDANHNQSRHTISSPRETLLRIACVPIENVATTDGYSDTHPDTLAPRCPVHIESQKPLESLKPK
jgi:hypothetical protein